MFGMAILNHMNMTGDNICVKLKLFDEKISDVDKIKFSIYDDLILLKEIEIESAMGEDEYSSPFVMFEELEIEKKYKVTIECYKDGKWEHCCECFTGVFTYSFQNNVAVYSEKISTENNMPKCGLGFKNDYDLSSGMSFRVVR